MARKKVPNYQTGVWRDKSPFGNEIKMIGGKPHRLVGATLERGLATKKAAQNNGKVQRCTIDGANAFSIWYPK